MLSRHLLHLPLLIGIACTPVRGGARDASVSPPRVDYHQHLVSSAFAPIAKLPPRDGKALLAELDSAGIQKAVVLSVGYSYGDERKALPEPDRLTRAENDWTSAQVVAANGRLIGFCSANPLRPAALAELDRCLGLPGMRGIKLHFGNAGITLREPAHAARVAEVFSLAERRGAPVLVHMRARGGRNYGAEDARLFLDRVVTVAPSIEIVVAHLAGSGPGYTAQQDSLMEVFGAAAERADPWPRLRFSGWHTQRRAECGADATGAARYAEGDGRARDECDRASHDRRAGDLYRHLRDARQHGLCQLSR